MKVVDSSAGQAATSAVDAGLDAGAQSSAVFDAAWSDAGHAVAGPWPDNAKAVGKWGAPTIDNIKSVMGSTDAALIRWGETAFRGSKVDPKSREGGWGPTPAFCEMVDRNIFEVDDDVLVQTKEGGVCIDPRNTRGWGGSMMRETLDVCTLTDFACALSIPGPTGMVIDAVCVLKALEEASATMDCMKQFWFPESVHEHIHALLCKAGLGMKGDDPHADDEWVDDAARKLAAAVKTCSLSDIVNSKSALAGGFAAVSNMPFSPVVTEHDIQMYIEGRYGQNGLRLKRRELSKAITDIALVKGLRFKKEELEKIELISGALNLVQGVAKKAFKAGVQNVGKVGKVVAQLQKAKGGVHKIVKLHKWATKLRKVGGAYKIVGLDVDFSDIKNPAWERGMAVLRSIAASAGVSRFSSCLVPHAYNRWAAEDGALATIGGVWTTLQWKYPLQFRQKHPHLQSTITAVRYNDEAKQFDVFLEPSSTAVRIKVDDVFRSADMGELEFVLLSAGQDDSFALVWTYHFNGSPDEEERPQMIVAAVQLNGSHTRNANHVQHITAADVGVALVAPWHDEGLPCKLQAGPRPAVLARAFARTTASSAVAWKSAAIGGRAFAGAMW